MNSAPAILILAAAVSILHSLLSHPTSLQAVLSVTCYPTVGSLLLVAGAYAAYPSDPNVAVGTAYYLLQLWCLCIFIPYVYVALMVGLGSGVLMFKLANPAVIQPRGMASRRSDLEDDVANVLFAGSFNPLHAGHLALLRTLAEVHPSQCSRIYACIGYNPNKHYDVSVQKRREMLATACKADPVLAGRVEVVVVPQYPWRFAVRHDVKYMYRGIRTWAKDGRAETILALLNMVGPFVLEGRTAPATRYIEADPELAHVSSTVVRKRAKEGGSLKGLVPDAVMEEVSRVYSDTSS